MYISKGAENIFFVLSIDVRHAEVVKINVYLFMEISQRQRSAVNRFLCEQENINGTYRDDDENQQYEKNAFEIFHEYQFTTGAQRHRDNSLHCFDFLCVSVPLWLKILGVF